MRRPTLVPTPPAGRLADTFKAVDKARDDAVNVRFNVENAAGILDHLAFNGWGDDDQEGRWLQVGYLARMLKQHASDLGAALDRIEALSLGRGAA